MLQLTAHICRADSPSVTATLCSCVCLCAMVAEQHSVCTRTKSLIITPSLTDQSASVRALIIQDMSDAELLILSNFITLDDKYITTADGQIFFVKD